MPAIRLSDPPDAPPLGLYGELHKRHLREHRPILYSRLLLSEKLYPLCREIDEAAWSRQMFDVCDLLVYITTIKTV